MSVSLMLVDMSCAEPAAALGRAPAMDQWGVYEYETDAVKGKAIYCRPFANPPELRLELPARGWHRIYLGIHYGHTHSSHAAKLGSRVVDQTPWLGLTGERAHRLVEPELYGTKGHSQGEWFGFADVVEVLWRATDLSGQDLHIAPRRSPRFPGFWDTYCRVPRASEWSAIRPWGTSTASRTCGRRRAASGPRLGSSAPPG